MKVTKKISNSGQKIFFKLVLLFSRICQAKIEQCTVLIMKGLYFDHKSIYSYTRFSRARTSAILFAFAQNGTAAAAPRAARVPIDNEQSKYFLFQLSFVSQSGGIPLSFLLSFHLYTFMQGISSFCILSCYVHISFHSDLLYKLL